MDEFIQYLQYELREASSSVLMMLEMLLMLYLDQTS